MTRRMVIIGGVSFLDTVLAQRCGLKAREVCMLDLPARLARVEGLLDSVEIRSAHSADWQLLRSRATARGRRRGDRQLPCLDARRARLSCIRGDGSMVRDYIHIDVVSAVLATRGSLWRLQHGPGQGYSITDIYNAIRRVTGTPPEM